MALLATQVANADVTPAGIEQADSSTGISETKMEPGFFDTIGKTFGVNYYGQVYGPALTNKGTKTLYSTDDDGAAQPMYLYNEVRLDYKTGKRFNVRINNRFEIYPLTDSSRPQDSTGFVMKNMRAGIVGLIVDPQSNGFSMASSLVAELPLSSASQAISLLAAPRLSLNPNIDIVNSRWSLGTYLTAAAPIYLTNNTTDRNLYFYFGPYANYRLTDTLQATFQLNMETEHKYSNLWNPSTTDVQLGVNWDVSKKFSFNPYLHMFPENLSANTTFIGANISATLL